MLISTDASRTRRIQAFSVQKALLNSFNSKGRPASCCYFACQASVQQYQGKDLRFCLERLRKTFRGLQQQGRAVQPPLLCLYLTVNKNLGLLQLIASTAFLLQHQPVLYALQRFCLHKALQRLCDGSTIAMRQLRDAADEDGSSQQRVAAMWLQPQQTTMLLGRYPWKGLRIQNCQDAKAWRVYSNVTTVVECNKYLVLNEIELQNCKRRLNSAVLWCGATTFCRRLACAKPALSQIRQVRLYSLTLRLQLNCNLISAYRLFFALILN